MSLKLYHCLNDFLKFRCIFFLIIITNIKFVTAQNEIYKIAYSTNKNTINVKTLNANGSVNDTKSFNAGTNYSGSAYYTNPRISHDGKFISFNSNRSGVTYPDGINIISSDLTTSNKQMGGLGGSTWRIRNSFWSSQDDILYITFWESPSKIKIGKIPLIVDGQNFKPSTTDGSSTFFINNFNQVIISGTTDSDYPNASGDAYVQQLRNGTTKDLIYLKFSDQSFQARNNNINATYTTKGYVTGGIMAVDKNNKFIAFPEGNGFKFINLIDNSTFNTPDLGGGISQMSFSEKSNKLYFLQNDGTNYDLYSVDFSTTNDKVTSVLASSKVKLLPLKSISLFK